MMETVPPTTPKDVLRVAGGLAAGRLGGLSSTLFSPPADAIDLPSYPMPGRSAARH